MDRVLDWFWTNHRQHYSWGVFAVAAASALPPFLGVALADAIIEQSDRLALIALLAVVVELLAMYLVVLPGSRWWSLIEGWSAGASVDDRAAVESTYAFTRTAGPRGLATVALLGGLLGLCVGTITGASVWRLVGYTVIGATLLGCVALVAIHQFVEMWLRPCRLAMTAESAMGDDLPRLRPSFATWANLAIIATAYIYSVSGSVWAAAFDPRLESPLLWVAIGVGQTLIFAVPLTLGTAFIPAFRPIRDLAGATKRVAAGQYGQRVPVVQDDDLGALTASFNRMQAGLAERQRLHAAFGSYVDPALAERLLAQGDELFTGEEVNVTVFFADIRNFTPYAEHATASEAVVRLNSLWDVIVPILRDHHGHANKFLGDGVLAVFGVPEQVDNHADHAIAAAMEIQRRIRKIFGADLRIGIGINTGDVIAGTIGGGGKLEFTLIGDHINIAARVEQLTKETGDAILLTQATADALLNRPDSMQERGEFPVRGREASVAVYALDPNAWMV